ncbi:MAG TPA: hypothetical protein VME69_01640 [Methylocella sp.]|nr:hypothetical protein [Methylocella sp.]
MKLFLGDGTEQPFLAEPMHPMTAEIEAATDPALDLRLLVREGLKADDGDIQIQSRSGPF